MVSYEVQLKVHFRPISGFCDGHLPPAATDLARCKSIRAILVGIITVEMVIQDALQHLHWHSIHSQIIPVYISVYIWIWMYNLLSTKNRCPRITVLESLLINLCLFGHFFGSFRDYPCVILGLNLSRSDGLHIHSNIRCLAQAVCVTLCSNINMWYTYTITPTFLSLPSSCLLDLRL